MAPSPEDLAAMLAIVARWRSDAEATLACPRCGAAGLLLADHSARPYAEWYKISCGGCGLDETLHIPLSPPNVGGLD